MEKDELTLDEKATLLGHVDARLCADYDDDFYNDLCSTNTPIIDEVNDRSRRAIVKYITAMWHDYKDVSTEFDDDTKFMAALTEALLKGYELGRKRKCAITGGR